MCNGLVVDGVRAGYGGVEVLHGVNIKVEPGELVAVIGSNAAGKTTLMRTIMGFVSATSGHIRFGDEEIANRKPHEIARLGIASVFGRDIFPSLSVRANLLLAGRRRSNKAFTQRLSEIHDLFPALLDGSDRRAGTLSGGQQQMLTLAMALVSQARLTLLDEPSMGLSPKVVDEFYRIVAATRTDDTGVLLVEQNAVEAFRIVDRAYVVEQGTVVHAGTPSQLIHESDVRRAYLGI